MVGLPYTYIYIYIYIHRRWGGKNAQAPPDRDIVLFCLWVRRAVPYPMSHQNEQVQWLVYSLQFHATSTCALLRSLSHRLDLAYILYIFDSEFSKRVL